MYWAGRQGTGEQEQPEREEEGPVWGSRRAAAKRVSRARLGGWHGPGALERCSPEGFQ